LIEIRAIERAAINLSRCVSGKGQLVVGDLSNDNAEKLFSELEQSATPLFEDSSFTQVDIYGKTKRHHCIKRTWRRYLPKLQHNRWNYQKFRHIDTGMLYRIYISRLSLIHIPIIYTIRLEISYAVEVHDGFKWVLM